MSFYHVTVEIFEMSTPPQNAADGSKEPPYSYSQDQADSIVLASTYNRRDSDFPGMWFHPRTQEEAVTIISSPARDTTATTSSLGSIDRLPLELVIQICLVMDIASLFYFRQTNVRARKIVNGLHEFRIVTQYAFKPLYALLRTRRASGVSLMEFYKLLCTHQCSICQELYGHLVHLLAWMRVCPRCLQSRDLPVRVATVTRIKQVLKLPKNYLMSLERLFTLPGVYMAGNFGFSRRMTIMLVEPALALYNKLNSRNQMIEAAPDLIRKLDALPTLEYLACCVIPNYDPHTKKIGYGVFCVGCVVAAERISGGPTHFPIATEEVDTAYSLQGFLKHFTSCEEAQAIWSRIREGANKREVWPRRLLSISQETPSEIP